MSPVVLCVHLVYWFTSLHQVTGYFCRGLCLRICFRFSYPYPNVMTIFRRGPSPLPLTGALNTGGTDIYKPGYVLAADSKAYMQFYISLRLYLYAYFLSVTRYNDILVKKYAYFRLFLPPFSFEALGMMFPSVRRMHGYEMWSKERKSLGYRIVKTAWSYGY